MIAECSSRAFGGSPSGRRYGQLLLQESQLWWRGQVFTSSPPHRALSLTRRPQPPPAATCSPIQQLLLPLLPPLDCYCCCFQVWIRRSQITLVHPPFLPRPPASLSRSASVYKAPRPTMRPLICSRNEVGSSWDGIIRDAFLRDRSESIFPLNQSPPPTPPPTTHNLFLVGRLPARNSSLFLPPKDPLLTGDTRL